MCRYDQRFSQIRNTVNRVLEVGVFFGASIQMWQSYFPSAKVVGLDTFKGQQGFTSTEGPNAGKRLVFRHADKFLLQWRAKMAKGSDNPLSRVHLVVGNQSDPADMKRVIGSELLPLAPFDIVVEDGSHRIVDQLVNL